MILSPVSQRRDWAFRRLVRMSCLPRQFHFPGVFATLGSMRSYITAIIALVIMLPAFAVPAMSVRLPALFTDGMVIQRDVPIHVWGWGDEGERVAVKQGRHSASASVKDGKWSALLQPMRAGGPLTLAVTGSNKIEVKDVLIGEVWLCAGQSNMQFVLMTAFESEQAIANASNPMIRLFTVPILSARRDQEDVQSSWRVCSPESAGEFSAVGYFFGRDLQKALKVPIGLISASRGGTAAEAWIWYSYALDYPELTAILSDVQMSELAAGIPAGQLYNGMIAPFVQFPIKGVIWYQGESSAQRARQYRTVFPAMIRSWRDSWAQGDFPFLLVQLVPYATTAWPKDSWAEIRETQLLTAKLLPKVGMAVITDVGEENDIHPKRKEPVGARLALAARAIAYGEKIEYSGPIYKSLKTKGDKIILSFTHVGKGLEARGGQLTGFEVAGSDGVFVPAVASIEGKTVIVSSPRVAKPTAVRYGCTNCPVVNLFNKNGLPASPFRTSH